MKTSFVVSAILENFFFTTLEEAQQDFQWGVETCKKEKISGTIYLYEIPINTNEELNENDYFLSCLENETAEEIKTQTLNNN